MRKLKLIWDFRGPGAIRTAEHHEIHLKEYIVSENIDVKLTGHEALNDLHAITFIVVNEDIMKPLRDRLKPHRGQLFEE